MLLDKSISSLSLTKIVDAIKAENETIINDIHIWKIAPAHHAAILSVSAKNPLETGQYQQILKDCLPQLSHSSIEVQKL